MNATEFIESCKPLKDKWGQITPEGKVCQNPMLFSVEYMSVLKHKYPDDQQATHEFVSMARLLWRLFDKGVLKRNPDNEGGQDSRDNAIAGAHLCALTNRQDLARMYLDHAIRHAGFMVNDHSVSLIEKRKAWMYRFPSVFFCMKLAADVKPNLVEKKVVRHELKGHCEKMGFGSEGFVKDQDGLALSWHLKEIVNLRRHLVDNETLESCFWFRSSFERIFVGAGMGQVRADYWRNNGGKDHPLARGLWGMF